MVEYSTKALDFHKSSFIDRGHRLGSLDGKFDPDTIKVWGEKVALEKKEIAEEVERDGVVIPNYVTAGYKGANATVIALSDEVREKYGLEIGDKVKFDDTSSFYDSYPKVVVNAENIIVKVAEDESYIPLKNTIFVREVGTIHDLDSDDSIIVAEKHSQAKLGEVLLVDNEDLIKVGDKILIQQGGDFIMSDPHYGEFYIFKQEDIPVVIQD